MQQPLIPISPCCSTRKGKLIFFYEWALNLKWEGTLLDDEEKVTGVIEVPNLSEENDSESVDVSVCYACPVWLF